MDPFKDLNLIFLFTFFSVSISFHPLHLPSSFKLIAVATQNADLGIFFIADPQWDKELMPECKLKLYSLHSESPSVKIVSAELSSVVSDLVDVHFGARTFSCQELKTVQLGGHHFEKYRFSVFLHPWWELNFQHTDSI